MKFVIVTGLSGSGKSEAMKSLEDIGFYCVDNLPPALLPKFAEICYQAQSGMEKVALGIDIRGYKFFKDLNNSLEYLNTNGFSFEILFLEAEDEVLVRRYKMTRRRHPLSTEDNILEGIQRERSIVEDLKKRASHIINTTNMKAKDLKEQIVDIYEMGKDLENMVISVTSFGFKHGIPIDADLVLDVRFLPNPYYVEDLREKTGENQEVQAYVMDSEVSEEFLKRTLDFLDFLVPQYIEEGKDHLVVAIGCTGGKHRSVTIANKIFDYLKAKEYKVFKKHRDYTLK